MCAAAQVHVGQSRQDPVGLAALAARPRVAEQGAFFVMSSRRYYFYPFFYVLIPAVFAIMTD